MPTRSSATSPLPLGSQGPGPRRGGGTKAREMTPCPEFWRGYPFCRYRQSELRAFVDRFHGAGDEARWLGRCFSTSARMRRLVMGFVMKSSMPAARQIPTRPVRRSESGENEPIATSMALVDRSRHRDDGTPHSSPAQFPCACQAVHHWHLDVHQDEVKGPLLHNVECLRSVEG